MLSLDPVTINDTDTVWKLRNDVATRRELGLKVVSYSECLDWVANIVEGKSEDTLLLAKDDKIGIVGFVILNPHLKDSFYIKVSIGSAFRGNGHGRRAIRLANAHMKGLGAKKLVAEIRGENYKALFAFEDNGYSETGTFIHGPIKTEYLIYEWTAG